MGGGGIELNPCMEPVSVFPVFISPVVRNMCGNLHYEKAYFEELHNDQEYY